MASLGSSTPSTAQGEQVEQEQEDLPLLQVPQGEEEARNRSQPGDENSLQILVLLPQVSGCLEDHDDHPDLQGKLQEDVQSSGRWLWRTLPWATDMASSVSSGESLCVPC